MTFEMPEAIELRIYVNYSICIRSLIQVYIYFYLFYEERIYFCCLNKIENKK